MSTTNVGHLFATNMCQCLHGCHLPHGRIRAGCLVIVSHAQRDPPLDLSAALSVFAVAMHTMNNTLVMHNFDRSHDMMLLTFCHADQEHKGCTHHIKVAHEMLMQVH